MQARNHLRTLLQQHDVRDISGLIRIDRIKLSAAFDKGHIADNEAFKIVCEVRVCLCVRTHVSPLLSCFLLLIGKGP